jgi:hypothetical protein
MPLPGRFKCYSCKYEHRIKGGKVTDFEHGAFQLNRDIFCEKKEEIIEYYRKFFDLSDRRYASA